MGCGLQNVGYLAFTPIRGQKVVRLGRKSPWVQQETDYIKWRERKKGLWNLWRRFHPVHSRSPLSEWEWPRYSANEELRLDQHGPVQTTNCLPRPSWVTEVGKTTSSQAVVQHTLVPKKKGNREGNKWPGLVCRKAWEDYYRLRILGFPEARVARFCSGCDPLWSA